ncbi:hypothetical protein MTBBW1_400003 [Desulfamplus magnetovallimortis]|uniref:Uncharacterized protein n=1 Tax=Desulfamplus magnetovallimortis TaxID=1246637 RepID=A0A1W1HGN1_9BACT|nr:AAA family ATPase [Desulfamplus magnetovallimortis]SLM31596.1 hypothetical protein MTBBW1_400003 [Desulfamplus magnetovallimortis]
MPHIKRMADQNDDKISDVMEELLKHYNGYRFSKRKVKVFNPFSLMTALKYMDIANYWFETGTPSFLNF